MKKVLSFMMLFTAVLFCGSTKVKADGYWEEYFKDKPIQGYTGCGLSGPSYLTEWKSMEKTELVTIGGCGDYTTKFVPSPGTYNLVFDNVGNITIKSSNENIVTATTRPYDFSYEKQNYENYIAEYNKTTFEEFLEKYFDDSCTGNEGKFIGVDACLAEVKEHRPEEYEKIKNKEKPTWWEFSDFKTEPKTWWEAYEFTKEPQNAKEVISYAKDLGKGILTLSADGKQDITIGWTIKATDLGINENGSSSKGLAQIFNNLEKYKDVIPTPDTYRNYHYSYRLSENEDISEAINALKGKDITVLFTQYTSVGESTYLLNGKDIQNEVAEGFTYEHDISMETSINKDKIDSLVNLQDAIYIDFKYHGSLPTEYKLSVNVKNYIMNVVAEKLTKQYCGEIKEEDYEKLEQCWNDNKLSEKLTKETEEYLKNTNLTLLYYNPEKDEMEVVAENLKAVDGNVELIFDHFSTYVLTSNYEVKEKKSNNAQTGTLNVVLYSLLAGGSLVGVAYLGLKNKKKKN